MCGRAVLQGGHEKPLGKAVKVKPGWAALEPQDIGDARAVGYLPRIANRAWNQPRERSVLQLTKLKRDLKSTSPSDREMQSLEFAQLVFNPALVPHFLTRLFFLPFRMVMYTLCH